MAIERVINIVANVKQASAEIKDLYTKLLDTELATQKLNEEAEKTGEIYEDSSDQAVKGINKQSTAMKGLKSIAGGVKTGFVALGNAFKAIGIGLIIGLVAKFTQVLSENKQVVEFVSDVSTTLTIVINELINKFIDIFSSISEATGGFDALGKVVGGVVKIAFNQLKSTVLSLQAAFYGLKLAYENVFGDDESVKKAQKDLIDIGKKLAEIQKDNIQQGKNIVNNIGEAVGEIVTGVTILTTESIKAISEVDLKAAYSQAKTINANKKNFELLALQQARLQLIYQNQAELQRQIRDDTSKGLKERLEANEKIAKILDKQFNAEKATITSRIAGLQNEQNLLGYTNERYNEIYQLQTDLIDVEERLNGARSEQLTNTNGLLQEQKDLLLSQVQTQNEYELNKKQFDADQAKTEIEKLELLKEKIALEQEQSLQDLERKRLLYLEDTQNRADAENEYILKKQDLDNQLIENAKSTAAEEKRIEQEVTDAKKAIRDSNIENISSGIGLLKQLFEKSKGLQKAALIAESAVGIGKIIINTQSANAASTLKYAALPGGIALATAERAANNVGAGISIAATVAATAKGLKELGGGSAPAGNIESGGGSSQPTPPSFNLIQGTESNQIAESLAGQKKPIQAFVVSKNVTSAQEADRNSYQEATL